MPGIGIVIREILRFLETKRCCIDGDTNVRVQIINSMVGWTNSCRVPTTTTDDDFVAIFVKV